MNDYFTAYLESARRLAAGKGLSWVVALETDGTVRKADVWDLSALVGAPPPRSLLADLGEDAKCLEYLNAAADSSSRRTRGPLPRAWQELVKAAAIDQVLVRMNHPHSAACNVVRPLRILATCASGVEPWDLTRDAVERASAVARKIQRCGKLAELIVSVVKDVIDRNHLADRCPLMPPSTFQRHRPRNPLLLAPSPTLRKHLTDRKNAERLPSSRALWELVRIVLTEKPRTFMDTIRFAQCKLLLLCGFRIGEACMLPADWRRDREYFDGNGRPAGEAGGISRSLTVRHFAEKQRGLTADSVALFEAFHHVPAMFEEALVPTLEHVAKITEPLRQRLRAQTETGRCFPEYAPSALMPAIEFFVRLFGLLRLKDEELPADLLAKYQSGWDPVLLDQLRAAQCRSDSPLRMAVRTTWSRLNIEKPLPAALDPAGRPWRGRERIPWTRSFFRVADIEAYVATEVPTKLPDRSPMRLGDGRVIYPHELLFIGPKRSLVEERNDGVCDVGMYFSVGHVDGVDLTHYLGGRSDPNFFTRYGQTEEDRALSLNSHSLRHLQTTELYRLGISELYMTKRFNRRSFAENRRYKHVTLAEDLDALEIPAGAEKHLDPRGQDTLRLISAGKLRGPLVDEFRRIQREEGDQQAFAFLQVEADGFHATPYGFCLNSFTVDPCPKHLECFNGCRHLALSPVDEHRQNLEQMRDTLQGALARIQELPAGHVGRENQLRHAKIRLANVERALAATPGSRPFADGEDRSVALEGG